MNVLFNPMICSNKAQNISCKGKADSIKEVRDTEKYLKNFNKNGCKDINTYVQKKHGKADKWFERKLNMHPTLSTLVGTGIGILIGLSIAELVKPFIDKVMNKNEVEKYAPQAAERISRISDKDERTIAYQEAADSIKTAHSFKNTTDAINTVIISEPNKACEIINQSSSMEIIEETFRKEADRLKKRN